MKEPNVHLDPALKQEILLQINQRLYEKEIITKDVYEEAKAKIVSAVC